MYKLISSLFLCFICGLTAVSQVGIGEWRIHNPFYEFVAITQSSENIYGATPQGVMIIDKNTQIITHLNKTNVLSDIDITDISYDIPSKTLIVGYGNGNLDLIKENSAINIPAIKNSSIIGDKTINNITVNSGFAYLATSFGIVVIDLSKEEVSDTYIIGNNGTQIKVNDVAFNDTSILAATEEGLYFADKTNEFLANYSSWQKDQTLLLPNANYSLVTTVQNTIALNFSTGLFAQDTVYLNQGMGWSILSDALGQNSNSFETIGNQLVIAHEYNVSVYRLPSGNKEENIFSYSFNNGSPRPNDALFDGDNYWIADKNAGMVKAYNSWSATQFLSEGPRYSDVFHMSCENSVLWVACGSITGGAWLQSTNQKGLSSFKDEEWNYYNKNNTDALDIADSIFDFLRVTVDPDDEDHAWAGSFSYGGLFEFQNGQVINRYTPNNSSLEYRSDRAKWIEIGGMTYDEDGNLWYTNAHSIKPLGVYTKEGDWYSFDFPEIKDNLVSECVIDDFNNKWIIAPGTGLGVYNENETVDNSSDDSHILLNATAGKGGLSSTDIYSIAKDLDGEIWVGSSSGLQVFYSPSSVFSGSIDADEILIEQDGNVQILFETESITSIAVDGANRKWCGTSSSGVFLMSEDGQEQVYHFTMENSPLPSNTIVDITIDNETGAVYFGTSKGIVSYRSEATEGNVNYSEIKAFPNPVREDYFGPIAIKGLMAESTVKFTDVAGNLVFETTSYGGQAIWDGNTMQGSRVTTGVYLVFVVDNNGNEAAVTKILVVN